MEDNPLNSQALEKREVDAVPPTEKDLEKDLFQKGRESVLAELNLPESAEQKMERLENVVTELASIASQLSPELYASNKEKFNELNNQVQQKLAELKVLLITFETIINLEYPKVPTFQKLAILLISLTNKNIQESTLVQTFGGNKTKRSSLLDSLNKFNKLHHEYSCKIEEAKTSHIKLAHRELLISNQEYEVKNKKLRDAEKDLKITQDYDPNQFQPTDTLKSIWLKYGEVKAPNNRYDLKNTLISILAAEIQNLKKEINQIEENTLIEAKQKENGK